MLSCRPWSRSSSRPRSSGAAGGSTRSPSVPTRPMAGLRSCSTCAPARCLHWPQRRTSMPTSGPAGSPPRDYAALTDPEAGQPLLNRAAQGATAPASTFKAISTIAALEAGYSTTASYPCPSSYEVGGRPFKNYRSRSYDTDGPEAGHGGVLRHDLLPVGPSAVARRWRIRPVSPIRVTSSPARPRTSGSADPPGSTCRGRPPGGWPPARTSRRSGSSAGPNGASGPTMAIPRLTMSSGPGSSRGSRRRTAPRGCCGGWVMR